MDGRKQRLPTDDDVIHHLAHALQGMLSYAHRLSFFMWKGQNDSNTLPVRARLFNRQKKSSFLKIFRYVWISVDKVLVSLP